MMTMSMINVHHHHHHHHHPLPLLKNKKPIPNPYRSSSQNITFSFFILSTNNYYSLITNQNQKRFSKQTHLHSFLPWNSSSSSSSSKPLKKNKFSSETVLLCVYIAIFLCLRLFFTTLPPDFPRRWSNLIVYSEDAETRVSDYPSHLLEAVVACEDRRFYRHWGIDPIGIARAVLSLSANGGGSTITQQLVKNTLLKNERTFSRKAVEMVLALLLERRISKRKILCTYLNKIYWGHGVFGIKSASLFYFGKHPSLLSVGESAMLVGIIPAPEFRSPFKHLSRGKTFQVRALRRMVGVGFLDMETALAIVDQPLHLRIDGPKHPNRQFYFSHKEVGDSGKQGGRCSTLTDIWDWEQESCMWELREYMEKWGARVPKSTPSVFLSCKLTQNHFPRIRLVRYLLNSNIFVSLVVFSLILVFSRLFAYSLISACVFFYLPFCFELCIKHIAIYLCFSIKGGLPGSVGIMRNSPTVHKLPLFSQVVYNNA